MLLLNPLSMGFGKRHTGFGSQHLGIKLEDSSMRRRASEMPNLGVIESNRMLFKPDYKIGVLPVDGENVIEGLRSNNSVANTWKSGEGSREHSRRNSMDNIEINFLPEYDSKSENSDKEGRKAGEKERKSSGNSSWEFHMDQNSMEQLTVGNSEGNSML